MSRNHWGRTEVQGKVRTTGVRLGGFGHTSGFGVRQPISGSGGKDVAEVARPDPELEPVKGPGDDIANKTEGKTTPIVKSPKGPTDTKLESGTRSETAEGDRDPVLLYLPGPREPVRDLGLLKVLVSDPSGPPRCRGGWTEGSLAGHLIISTLKESRKVILARDTVLGDERTVTGPSPEPSWE